MRYLQILAIFGLSLLAFRVAVADDVRGKKGTGRESARVDTQDPKEGPILHVPAQGRAVSRSEQPFSYREWRLERRKLPWEPNAPGG